MSSSPPPSTCTSSFAHRASQFKSNPLSDRPSSSGTARRLAGREADQKQLRTAQVKAQRLASISHASAALLQDDAGGTSSSSLDNIPGPSFSTQHDPHDPPDHFDPMKDLEDLEEMALDSDEGDEAGEATDKKGKGKARASRRYKGRKKNKGRCDDGESVGGGDGKGAGATTGERKRDRKERAALDPLKNVLTQATLFPLPPHHPFLSQPHHQPIFLSDITHSQDDLDTPSFSSDGLPSNLTSSYIALSPIPRGKRCLCVIGPLSSNPAATLHSRISARVLMRWTGCGLPGETVLDCVLDDGWKMNGILHVIDILRWRSLSIASSEASFRQFFLISRLAELPPPPPPPSSSNLPSSSNRYSYPVHFRPIPALFPPVSLPQWRTLAIAGVKSVAEDEERAGGVKGRKGMGFGMIVMDAGCEYLYGDEAPKVVVSEGRETTVDSLEGGEMASKVGWIGGEGWEAFGSIIEARIDREAQVQETGESMA